jgi:hypothetical protein
MNNDSYRLPITTEYSARGCIVNINAATNKSGVDIKVQNIKTGKYGKASYLFIMNDDDWYSRSDILEIQNIINNLLDKYGDSKCLDIHFTNQILS